MNEDQKTFYLELSLSTVIMTDEKTKEELLAKINKYIEKMVKGEVTVQFASSCNIISEEQLYAEYASSISQDFN